MFKQLLTVAGLVGAVGSAQAVDIQFDGYCDGIVGLTDLGSSATGTWSNLDCFGTNAALGGPRGRAAGNASGGTIMGSFGVGAPYGAEFTWVINRDHTFLVYRANDGVFINAGTYSIVGTEGARTRGTKSAAGL